MYFFVLVPLVNPQIVSAHFGGSLHAKGGVFMTLQVTEA